MEYMKKVRMCLLEKLISALTIISLTMSLLFIINFMIVKTKKLKIISIITSIVFFMIFIGGFIMEYYKII